ncbi:glutamic acid-rich protein-like [Cucumis melo var. makuwa]|uniref:Glutamic acid-rich protein-like n=1 Tax=Cucumis melo var. makuwa TaxID=1194695 RepID=A0A5D3C5E5_CUCMM|nr:glutamic acid-rich protein-like [Cucumis melo var. makuwa]TYK05606.1 glutamic acid-rich protein-like [Cucumis melo var. makuwa]
MLDSTPLHCRFTTIRPLLQHSCHYNSSNSTKFRPPHLNLSLIQGSGPMGFPVFAMKRLGKGGIALTQPSDSDIDFDEFFDEDEDNFQDEDEDNFQDEDEILLPLKNTREWHAARPRGFGEGKVYDTSIEDKLLQEMEQIREAQAANINKLKNQSSSKPNSSRNVVEIAAPEIVSTGVRVRIINLPKKKNINRDLVVAFKGFPGIINITPAVIGNKKTRDPICKGFAFVDCKSEGDALRYVYEKKL